MRDLGLREGREEGGGGGGGMDATHLYNSLQKKLYYTHKALCMLPYYIMS